MTSFDKAARLELLATIGREVEQEALKVHVAEGGDPKEIVFCEEKLIPLVDEYANALEKFREKHIDNGNFVAGDKIAAFTGTLIMRHAIFESTTEAVNTPYSSMVNEVFAMRISQLFTQNLRFNFPPPARERLAYCFGNCYDHDGAMHTWTVATMAHHLEIGNVAEQVHLD